MRIAPAIGSVLALVAVAVPTTPAHSSGARSASTSQESSRPSPDRTASRGDDIDVAASTPGASYVHVSWHWIRAASGYRIQVAKDADFTKVVTTRKKRNSNRRPAGGREATVVGNLRDATYYWVRVRKIGKSHKGPWSAPERVGTKAKMPDKITRTVGRPGPAPGTTKIRWRSDGGHTDYFVITTAITPFGSKSNPGEGRQQRTWRVAGSARSFTMTADQTAQAGAPLGSGRHLFFRIKAVRSGEADKAVRKYGKIASTPVTGQDSTAAGTLLRVATYNLHVASKDRPGHHWRDRQHLIAKNIAKYHPAVVALQELMPSMWTDYDGGVGLEVALDRAGVGQYELTRDTPYWKGNGQDSRILYDPTKVEMVSSCPTDTPSCYINTPDEKEHVAAYALFRDRESGQEFYFISAHLSAGNDAKTDDLRTRQAQAISDGIKAINQRDLPVIFGSDANSSQTSAGSDGPHTVLLNEGWYNSQAAEQVVNDDVNTVNHYETQTKSPYGFGAIYDTIATLNLRGATLWKQVLTGSPWPSDHNLVFADLRLP